MGLTDDQLELEKQIRACIEGDQQSFQYVFNAFKDKIFKYALSRTSSREDALDITQEVFISLWKALGKFKYQSLGQFHGFIFLVTRRRIIKHYRSRRGKIEVEFDDKQLDLRPENQTDDSLNFDSYHDLLANLKHLKTKHQEVLRLRYWSGLNFAEIAKVLKTKETTTKVWHHRAIKKLKQLFETK